MKLELSDDLVEEVRLLAQYEGRNLEDVFAAVVRNGLANASRKRKIEVTDAMLQERRQMTDKFLNGEWRAECQGFEEHRELDRREALRLERLWRDPDATD